MCIIDKPTSCLTIGKKYNHTIFTEISNLRVLAFICEVVDSGVENRVTIANKEDIKPKSLARA